MDRALDDVINERQVCLAAVRPPRQPAELEANGFPTSQRGGFRGPRGRRQESGPRDGVRKVGALFVAGS